MAFPYEYESPYPEGTFEWNVDWLARIVNAEAGGECYVNKLHTASVVINRSKRSGTSIKEVIRKPNQWGGYRKPLFREQPTIQSKMAAKYILTKGSINDCYFVVNLDDCIEPRPEWMQRINWLFTINGLTFGTDEFI